MIEQAKKIPPSAEELESDRMLWLVAKLAHSVNRAYCASIGDNSQVPWDESPEWQRTSAFEGVKKHSENPSMTPEESHESWLDLKKAEGWRYGMVKDEVSKTHPCFLPYWQLPNQQKAKDALFTVICKTMFGGE